MKIGYVSCVTLPEADFDEQPTIDALRVAGHDPVIVAWDDPSVDWESLDAAVVRATWNYAHHVESFAAWIDRVDSQTRLLNPASTMRWNLHKGYLRQLSDQGVPIVPTAFFDRAQHASIGDVAGSRGWTKIVIKPTISAGSFGTRVFDLSIGELNAAQLFYDEMNDRREMMVQTYINSVDTIGETSLVVIDGSLTHAIEKRLRLHGQDEQVFLRETISDEMHAIVKQVLDAADQVCLYARVDVMPDDDGTLMLSELELLEPSLFFPQNPSAAAALVRGIERMV